MAASNITGQGNVAGGDAQPCEDLRLVIKEIERQHRDTRALVEERRRERIALEDKVRRLELENFKTEAQVSDIIDKLAVVDGKIQYYDILQEKSLEDHQNQKEKCEELDKELLKIKQESEAWTEGYMSDIKKLTSKCKQQKMKNNPEDLDKLKKEIEAKKKDIEEKQLLKQELLVELGLDKENSVDLGEVYLAYYTNKTMEKLEVKLGKDMKNQVN